MKLRKTLLSHPNLIHSQILKDEVSSFFSGSYSSSHLLTCESSGSCKNRNHIPYTSQLCGASYDRFYVLSTIQYLSFLYCFTCTNNNVLVWLISWIIFFKRQEPIVQKWRRAVTALRHDWWSNNNVDQGSLHVSTRVYTDITFN